MEKRLPGLDLDALRSFVTGMECGSFAQAALRLSRSTSAVSAQLKKLESQCGAALVSKQGRHLVLTAEGEKLMSYARRLLALNDETLRTLQGERLTGEIHLGMQEDFGESLMPGILGQFKRHHPQVRIVARVDRNGPLRQALAEEALDLALLWQTEDQGPGLGLCPLAWIAHPDLDIRALLVSGEPLPLVMVRQPVPDALPRHCLSRCRGDPLAGGVRQPQPERHLGGGAGRAGPDDTHPHRHARQPAPCRRTPASARKSGRQPATNPA